MLVVTKDGRHQTDVVRMDLVLNLPMDGLQLFGNFFDLNADLVHDPVDDPQGVQVEPRVTTDGIPEQSDVLAHQDAAQSQLLAKNHWAGVSRDGRGCRHGCCSRCGRDGMTRSRSALRVMAAMMAHDAAGLHWRWRRMMILFTRLLFLAATAAVRRSDDHGCWGR